MGLQKGGQDRFTKLRVTRIYGLHARIEKNNSWHTQHRGRAILTSVTSDVGGGFGNGTKSDSKPTRP